MAERYLSSDSALSEQLHSFWQDETQGPSTVPLRGSRGSRESLRQRSMVLIVGIANCLISYFLRKLKGQVST